MTYADCAPSCCGTGCDECSPATSDTCEACLTDIDDALRIVAGTRVHARCALFWEGMIILGEWTLRKTCILPVGHRGNCRSENNSIWFDVDASKRFTTPTMPSPRPVVIALLRDVAAGIRVLNTMHGMCITEDLIQERANNIVAGLVGNYRIEEE